MPGRSGLERLINLARCSCACRAGSALKIEEAGESFLSSLAGPFLIAVAAIVAALVAAWVAWRNHEKQLDHDRELRDIEHARQSVNAAVETIAEVISAFSHLATTAWIASEAHAATVAAEAKTDELDAFHHDEHGELVDSRSKAEIDAILPAVLRAESDVIDAESDAIQKETTAVREVAEARDPAMALLMRLTADTLRLEITLGRASDVVKKHVILANAFDKWKDTLSSEANGHYDIDYKPEEEVRQILPKPLEDFVSACQRWSALATQA